MFDIVALKKVAVIIIAHVNKEWHGLIERAERALDAVSKDQYAQYGVGQKVAIVNVFRVVVVGVPVGAVVTRVGHR